MADFSFDLDGAEELKLELQEEAASWSGGGTAFVGTAVEYSVYVEYGTSKMDPRPYFRPALAEARGNIPGFIADNTNKTVASIDSADEFVETVALALERRVKEIITRKGLIDTGNLRASIRAVDEQTELLATEDVTV
jgi:predicted house-cleaning noncanonical NTP pyrophosphatase (MazG superfamily)